jgi:hypothetical protein
MLSREVPTSQNRQDQRADFSYEIAPILISIVASGFGLRSVIERIGN